MLYAACAAGAGDFVDWTLREMKGCWKAKTAEEM